MLRYPESFWTDLWGSHGREIYDRIRGIDPRTVKSIRQAKSIGRETTLHEDTLNKEDLCKCIDHFAESINSTLNRKGYRARTVTVKIKTCDFEQHTRSKTFEPFVYPEELAQIGCQIVHELNLEKPLRLIGLSVSNLFDEGQEQLSFFQLTHTQPSSDE